jgi:hypothetical protein
MNQVSPARVFDISQVDVRAVPASSSEMRQFCSSPNKSSE